MMNVIKQLGLTMSDLPEFARNPRLMGNFHYAQTEVLAGKTVEFKWPSKDVDYPIDNRKVTVKFALTWNGDMYVHGICHKHNALRTYNVSKMRWSKNTAGQMVKMVIV